MFSRPAGGGPPRRRRRARGAGSGLEILATLVALFATHAIITTNFDAPAVSGIAWLWRLHLFTVQTALTTLVAVCSLLLVRRQFVMGTRPYLTITSGRRRDSETGLPEGADKLWWQANLRNVGPGMALIKSSRYLVVLAGAPDEPAEVDAAQLRIMLAQGGSISRQHFTISHLSAGTAFAPAQCFVMFEADAQCLAQLIRLDLSLEYEGILGDLFTREISLIPSDRSQPA